MTNRRKFLQLMGVGAASAPLAAKEVMDNEALSLVMRGEEVSPLAAATSRAHEHHGGSSGENKFSKACEYLIRNGIPEALERSIREDAKFVMALDPDIANKRSWSMAVKIQEQRQRNYENKKASMLNSDTAKKGREAFKQALGFDWPWYL